MSYVVIRLIACNLKIHLFIIINDILKIIIKAATLLLIAIIIVMVTNNNIFSSIILYVQMVHTQGLNMQKIQIAKNSQLTGRQRPT